MKGPATKPTTNTPKRKLPELSTSASPTVRKNPFLDLLSPYSARPCTPCGPPLSVFSIGLGLAIKGFSVTQVFVHTGVNRFLFRKVCFMNSQPIAFSVWLAEIVISLIEVCQR